MSSINTALKLLILHSGKTQRQIGREAGIAETRLSAFARGRRPYARQEELDALARVLGTTADRLGVEIVSPKPKRRPARRRMNGEQHPLLLRVPDAAALLSVSEAVVYKMIRRHELSYVNIGKSCRVPLDELKDWIERTTTRARKKRRA